MEKSTYNPGNEVAVPIRASRLLTRIIRVGVLAVVLTLAATPLTNAVERSTSHVAAATEGSVLAPATDVLARTASSISDSIEPDAEAWGWSNTWKFIRCAAAIGSLIYWPWRFASLLSKARAGWNTVYWFLRGQGVAAGHIWSIFDTCR